MSGLSRSQRFFEENAIMAFTNYANTASQVQEAWTRAAESWTGGFQRILGQAPDLGLTEFDPSRAIDRYFDFAERVLEVNRHYAKTLAGASLNVGQAVRDQSTAITNEVSSQAGATIDATREQAEKAERVQAKKQERAAWEASADRYRDLTKVELSQELARRRLPRTGNVGQLRERLISADLKTV